MTQHPRGEMDEIPVAVEPSYKLAAALKNATSAGFWTGYSSEEREALLALVYHAIDEAGSGFESTHAKTLLDLMVKMSRRPSKGPTP